MKKVCPKCGSEKIIKGAKTRLGGVVLPPEKADGVINHPDNKPMAECKDCGAVFDLNMNDTNCKDYV